MNTNDLYPSYGMWHRPFWQSMSFYILLGIMACLIFGAAVWYVFKRYRAAAQRPLSPGQTAFVELLKLKQELAQETILGKTLYFRLTWIFKKYLYERYGFEVYGKTDEELLVYLEREGLSTDLVHDLRVIFEGSLDIKFAHQEAMLDRLNRDLEMSLEFIKKTVPAESPSTCPPKF